MVAAATPFVNMMEHEFAWTVILSNFGLSARSITRLTENHVTANDLVASKIEQVKPVVNLKTNTFRKHIVVARYCYIKMVQLDRILTFYRWTTYGRKIEYDEESAAIFELD